MPIKLNLNEIKEENKEQIEEFNYSKEEIGAKD